MKWCLDSLAQFGTAMQAKEILGITDPKFSAESWSFQENSKPGIYLQVRSGSELISVDFEMLVWLRADIRRF